MYAITLHQPWPPLYRRVVVPWAVCLLPGVTYHAATACRLLPRATLLHDGRRVVLQLSRVNYICRSCSASTLYKS